MSQKDTESPLVQHLIELRDRLIRILIVVVVLFLILAAGFAGEIYAIVSAPLQSILPEGSSMIATGVASPFITPFKLAFFVSVFMAMPYILYQIWGFVAPGLYAHERYLAIPLLVSSTLLFYAGMAFAYYVVFPLAYGFFAQMAPAGVTYLPDISSYLSIALKMFFAFGLAFEIPIATMLLIWTGTATVAGLRAKRPYVIVGCFFFGMLLTPPDIFSQTLLAIPMWILFEFGIIFGSWIKTRKPAPPEPDAPES